jgi:H2-forming N5,N10-methylenetetrahydromethanopterin dehydrogenase-like enzyme
MKYINAARRSRKMRVATPPGERDLCFGNAGFDVVEVEDDWDFTELEEVGPAEDGGVFVPDDDSLRTEEALAKS